MATKQEQMMRKVRGLLAKAEDPACTPEEAEAFSRKAEELIAQYAIDVAMLSEKRKAGRGKPTTLRMTIDKNYTTPRALIVQAVAKAFGCQLLLDGKTAIVVGFQADLDMVEALASSLLLQAANAMLHDSRESGARGDALWRYRQDHLLGFAQRVGIRLQDQYQEKVAATPGAGLVLRDRASDVEEEFRRLFPYTRAGKTRVGTSGGYRHGVSAADRADIGGQRLAGRKAIA